MVKMSVSGVGLGYLLGSGQDMESKPQTSCRTYQTCGIPCPLIYQRSRIGHRGTTRHWGQSSVHCGGDSHAPLRLCAWERTAPPNLDSGKLCIGLRQVALLFTGSRLELRGKPHPQYQRIDHWQFKARTSNTLLLVPWRLQHASLGLGSLGSGTRSLGHTLRRNHPTPATTPVVAVYR